MVNSTVQPRTPSPSIGQVKMPPALFPVQDGERCFYTFGNAFFFPFSSVVACRPDVSSFGEGTAVKLSSGIWGRLIERIPELCGSAQRGCFRQQLYNIRVLVVPCRAWMVSLQVFLVGTAEATPWAFCYGIRILEHVNTPTCIRCWHLIEESSGGFTTL